MKKSNLSEKIVGNPLVAVPLFIFVIVPVCFLTLCYVGAWVIYSVIEYLPWPAFS